MDGPTSNQRDDRRSGYIAADRSVTRRVRGFAGAGEEAPAALAPCLAKVTAIVLVALIAVREFPAFHANIAAAALPVTMSTVGIADALDIIVGGSKAVDALDTASRCCPANVTLDAPVAPRADIAWGTQGARLACELVAALAAGRGLAVKEHARATISARALRRARTNQLGAVGAAEALAANANRERRTAFEQTVAAVEAVRLSGAVNGLAKLPLATKLTGALHVVQRSTQAWVG